VRSLRAASIGRGHQPLRVVDKDRGFYMLKGIMLPCIQVQARETRDRVEGRMGWGQRVGAKTRDIIIHL